MKGDKNKKGCESFKSPGCHCGWRGRGLQQLKKVQWPQPPFSVIRSSNQPLEHKSPNIWRMGPFFPPWFLQVELQGASGMCARLAAVGLRIGARVSCCYGKELKWMWMKCSLHSSLLCKLQAFSRFWSSRIFTLGTFCLLSYLARKTDSWCFLLCHFPLLQSFLY